MKPHLLLTACLLTFSDSPVIADEVPVAIQAEVDGILKRHAIPGGVAAMVEDGKVTLKVASGVRMLGDPAPFTIDDKVHIGSCAKAMTATLAGILIDEGKLTWDTKIIDVFPEFAEQIHKEYRSVTISHLLSHYAGVPRNVSWRELGADDSLPEQRLTMMRQVFFVKPEHPPGKTYHYSNVGFVAAGAMLEKITAEPWEQLMTARLFKPLGMASAGFGPPGKDDPDNQPWGHFKASELQFPIQLDNAPALGPAGTIHLTMDDWGRFASLHAAAFDDQRVFLKPETMTHLQTPLQQFDTQLVTKSEPYGFGWIHRERDWGAGKVLAHNGSNTTWYATIQLAPKEKVAFMAAVNSATPESEEACNEMVNELIRHWSANPPK
jgi:CubicO group peptidase (beta-lactamase class C family)